MCIVICTLLLSRPARGAWVEILILIDEIGVLHCRAPQGARGLKYNNIKTKVNAAKSRPARGAWVEIFLPAGCGICTERSRPARGAWVEIQLAHDVTPVSSVAPRKGRVG